MKVIICGAGQVGSSIARQLANEDNHITLIDQSAALIGELTDQLDVKGVVGFASHPSVLELAGAREADMIIAVTYSDEVNMVACQVAHSLFNVPFKIARIRNQNYLQPVWRELYQHTHMPIDVIISPEAEVAKVVHDRLNLPGAIDVTSFAEGTVKMIAVRCTLDSPVRNKPLYKIQTQLLPLSASLLGIVRDGHFLIAEGDEQLAFNDEVYFIADSRHLAEVMQLFGYEEQEARRIIIVGGGNIGLFLAEQLEQDAQGANHVKIIEVNKERAEFIADKLSNSTVIHGSALDQTILEEAGVGTTELIIAVSNDDKVNILSALLAKRFGCRRSATLLNNHVAYGPLVASLGADIIVSPRETTVSSILRHIRLGKIRSVRAICDGKIEVMEAEAMEASHVIGTCVGDLDLPNDIVLSAIVRGNKQVIIPDEETVIQVGDRIVVLCTTAMVKKVEKIFSVKFEYF